MKKESVRLRGLIGQLKGADPTRQVRLVRVIFPRWLREHREAIRRVTRYRSRTTHPFDIDLGHRLDKPWSAIERMRAQAAAIPGAILKDIERSNIPRAAVLLDRLEHEFRRQDDETAPRRNDIGQIETARQIIKDHVSPPPLVPPRRVVIGKAFAFISHDIRARLDKMVQNGAQFDAIITHPSYRVSFNGRQVTATTSDGRRQPLWEPAVFARLIKPNRAICLFCTKDSLAGWTMALLEAGLLIHRVLRWQTPPETGRQTEPASRGDTLVLICGNGIPQIFRDDAELRRLAAPALRDDSTGLSHALDPMVRLIEAFTEPGDQILDPFAGAGAVGVAAISCRRDYLGAEADPAEAPKTIGRLQRAYDALQAQDWLADEASEVA